MAKKKNKNKSILDYLQDNLMAFAFLSLVLIGTTAFSLYSQIPNQENSHVKKTYEVSKSFTKIPVLTTDKKFPVFSARSIVAIDMDTGVTLYEKNPDESLLPASTTKILTALVALDYYSKMQVLTVDNFSVAGQKMGLVAGEKITVNDLLYGLLVYSANDAAEVLARNYPGGREMFISAMNLKAKEIGLFHTSFENPSGLDGEKQRTSSKDLVKAALYAVKNPFFAQIVSTKETTVNSVDGKIAHKLTNINQLLGEEGVLGVKTGWTQNARENLVTYVKRDGKSVMIALLGSQDRFGETKQLISWIFDNYDWQNVEYVYSNKEGVEKN